MVSKTLGCLAGGGKAQIFQSTLCSSKVSMFKAQPLFAPTCASQIPSSAVPGCAQGTLKASPWHSDSNSSLGQSKPWTQEQPLPTPAAATRLNQPAQSLIFWSLQVPVSAPCTLAQPWHCRKSPGPGRDTLILTHSTSPWLPTMHKAPTNQSTTPSSVLP